MTCALIVGHPNSGKTELFNALTDSHAQVGNWSGVTVDSQIGLLVNEDTELNIQDLPGLHSLMDHPENEDEKLALRIITQTQPDFLINVVNACQLERQLFLTSELLELGIPMMIVLSMHKLAQAQGLYIDPNKLSKQLGCPVVIFETEHPQHTQEIKQKLKTSLAEPHIPIPLNLPLSAELTEYLFQYQQETRTLFTAMQSLLHRSGIPDIDLQLANARYTVIHDMTLAVQVTQQTQAEQLTANLDAILLHRYFGLPLFLCIMYGMFFFAIHVGGIFQDFFDLSSNALLVQLPAKGLEMLHSPGWLTQLISEGIGKGLNTTLTFIPVLGAMYLCLTFIEGSGYMARAAFVMDRLMRLLGLPGKAFVPLIIGFGCNVPAILATRTLESKRDRYLTIFMSPFMSCSARLTIYTVFVSTFFPENGQNIIFILYLLGIIVAVLTGLMLQKTLFPSQLSPLLLELPPYHRPKFKRLCKMTSYRLKTFLKRAAQLIIPVSFVLSALNLIPANFFHPEDAPSLLAYLGQLLTPLFAPIGLEAENWPATVGLLTGILAKEVVIGSLNTLYHQISNLTIENSPVSITETFMLGLYSIPDHLFHLGQTFLHPLMSKVQTQTLSPQTNDIMKHYFKNTASVYAYLTFILLYLPCVSTMAAIKQETSSRLMWFSVLWSFFVAYVLAILVYQVASFALHPLESITWIIGLSFMVCGFILSLRRLPQRFGIPHAI
jgi:ferrous iron transport protein B